MAIDTLPTPQPATPEQVRDARLPRSPWGKRGLGVAALIVIVASAAGMIAAVIPAGDSGPRLTHTVTRGDLLVTVVEQGMLESAENTEIKCKVRGRNTVLWVIESGTQVQPGDELVRLDSLLIEEQIDERTKYAHWSRSAAERSAADVASAELAVPEYEQGRFVTALMTLEKELAVAESKLRSAEARLHYTEMMAASGYKSKLEIEEREFAVEQAELEVSLKQTEIRVLKDFTKQEQLKILQGNVTASKADHEANAERALADASRRDRALEEKAHCVVRAERGGMVIHPSAARWENAPEIAEGTTVHKDQVLLLMPDLSQMQVKVGIHESVVDRVKKGMAARVTLADKTLEGTVSKVASVTRPAGWWTGNEVRYDTLVQLPAGHGLRPGMSADVQVIIAHYQDVLTIPVAAVVETDGGSYCWVKTPAGPAQRKLLLGDTNEVFTIVQAGLKEGDQVVLHPLALSQSPAAKNSPGEAADGPAP
jgi:multidrug efflux pump subunit AcrA (membrane-fusion protein)